MGAKHHNRKFHSSNRLALTIGMALILSVVGAADAQSNEDDPWIHLDDQGGTGPIVVQVMEPVNFLIDWIDQSKAPDIQRYGANTEWHMQVQTVNGDPFAGCFGVHEYLDFEDPPFSGTFGSYWWQSNGTLTGADFSDFHAWSSPDENFVNDFVNAEGSDYTINDVYQWYGVCFVGFPFHQVDYYYHIQVLAAEPAIKTVGW